MMIFKFASTTTLLLLAAALQSSQSFSFQPNFLVRQQQSTSSLKYKSGEDDTKVAKRASTQPKMFRFKHKSNSVVQNIAEGKAGERGEGYVAVQGFLMLCIVFGGIPIVGGSLMFLLGPGLFLVGALTMILAVNDLGSSLSPWPVPSSNTDLVTDGLFSKMRHPIYAGLLCNLIGLSVSTGSVERLLLTGLLLWTLHKKTEFEEEELAKKFPEYEEYAKRVPGRFIPDN